VTTPLLGATTSPPAYNFEPPTTPLQHPAAIITPWIDSIAHCLKPGDCTLSMMNSTTSEGWLKNTHFSKLGDEPIQATICLEVAKMHAKNYMALEIWDKCQLFTGNKNIVADALSHNNNRFIEEFTLIFCFYYPYQIPDHFDILPLPNKIILWLTALLHSFPEKLQLFEKNTRTKLGCGTDGQATASASTLLTLSSTYSPSMHESSNLEPLLWLCRKQLF
jgi:hypothetical protein